MLDEYEYRMPVSKEELTGGRQHARLFKICATCCTRSGRLSPTVAGCCAAAVACGTGAAGTAWATCASCASLALRWSGGRAVLAGTSTPSACWIFCNLASVSASCFFEQLHPLGLFIDLGLQRLGLGRRDLPPPGRIR